MSAKAKKKEKAKAGNTATTSNLVKQSKCRQLIEAGVEPKEAALAAGYSPQYAKAIYGHAMWASCIMEGKRAFMEELEQRGISLHTIAEKEGEMLMSEDPAVVSQALKRLEKILGLSDSPVDNPAMAPIQPQTVNITNIHLTPEKQKEMNVLTAEYEEKVRQQYEQEAAGEEPDQRPAGEERDTTSDERAADGVPGCA